MSIFDDLKMIVNLTDGFFTADDEHIDAANRVKHHMHKNFDLIKHIRGAKTALKGIKTRQVFWTNVHSESDMDWRFRNACEGYLKMLTKVLDQMSIDEMLTHDKSWIRDHGLQTTEV